MKKEQLAEFGLSQAQIDDVMNLYNREQRYTDLMKRAKVSPIVWNKIINVTDVTQISDAELNNEDLMIEKIKQEWGAFLRHESK